MFIADVTVAFFTGVLFILVPLALRERVDSALDDNAYRALHSVLSPAELTFYLALTRAVGDNYVVLPKVALAGLVRTSRRLHRAAREPAEAQLRQLHVDFALCRRDTLTLWCVIQMNPGQEGTAQDRLLAHVLECADIPVVSFESRLGYEPAQLRRRIHGALKCAWRREQMDADEHPLSLSSAI